MSNVSAALSSALAELAWSQTKLAELSEIDRGMINRYVRGSTPLGSDNLPKLLSALPEPHNALVLAAFLRDATPAGSAHLVSILSNVSRTSELPQTLPTDLHPEIREALTYLARRAEQHVEIRDMLVRLAKVLRVS